MNNAVKIFGLEINVGRTPIDLEKVDKLILKTSKDIQRAKMDWLEYSQTLTSLQGHALILQFMKEFEAKAKTTTAARRTMTAEEKVAARAIRESAKVQEMQVLAEKSRIGSIRQLEAEISKLNILWKALSKEERTKTASGRAMTSQLTALRKEMRETKVAAGDFSGNIGNYMSAIYNGITSKFALISGVVMSLKRLVTGIFQPFQDLEYRMAMVKAVSGATSEEFAALEQNARELGASTEYTATEVAGLQLAYARMGFVPGQIMQITGATLDLATATGEDLAKSADVVGTTLKGFNLTADQTQRVVDVMAKSFNASSLQLDSFYEAMKYVAPIATVANVSLEETSAMLGVLADRGIRGSQAGTALRRIFTEMAKEGGSVSERLEQLSKQGLTLGGAMDEVGRYAMTALTVLAGSKGGVDELTGALYNAEGAAKAAADGIRDTMQGDLDKFLSAVQEKLISIGETLAPLGREALQVGTWVVTNLKQVITLVATYIGVIKAATVAKAAYYAVVKLAYGSTIAFGRAVLAETGAVARATAATRMATAAKLLFSASVEKVRMAVVGLGRALKANPWGWAITLIAAGASALSMWRSKVSEASKAFKEFTTELGKERTIATTLFDMLLKSSKGTQERAEAIKQINDKYGAYLPNLLSEKSTTEDIAAALQLVNEKLEENTRLKFKQQGIDAAAGELAEAEMEALNDLLGDYGAKSAQEIAVFSAAFRDIVDQIKSGAFSMTDVGDFSRRFNLVGSEALHVFVNLKYAVGDYLREVAKIDGLFGAGTLKTTATPPPQKIPPLTPDPKDKGEWSLSKDKDHNRQLLALKEQLHSGEISSEEQYQKQVLQLEIDTLAKRIALNKDEAKTITKLKNDLWDKQNQQKKSEQKADETYAANRKAQDEKELKYDNDHIDAGIAAMEDGVEKKIKLNEQATKKAQESAAKEYQAEVDGLDKQIKANEGNAAKVAEIEAEKTNLAGKYDQKTTDIRLSGADARMKILENATEEELEEYIKLVAGTILAEKTITNIKLIEAKKRAAIQKNTENGLSDADTAYARNEKIADKAHGTNLKNNKRRDARLQNEIDLRNAQAQTYMAQLKQLEVEKQEGGALYTQTIDNLAKVRVKLEDLGKGNGVTGWVARALGISREESAQLIQQAFDLATQIGDAIINAQQQASQRRLKNEKKAIDAQYKTESKLLDSRRDKGLISEKQYQKELEKLEANKAEKEEEAEKAAFEREKKLSIKQVIINTALSIAKTFALMGWIPGIPFAALAAASGAIQIATIASQKYAQGGLIPLGDGMGVVKGRSHAQGGHQIYIDGRPIGEIEGDELLAIVNKHDTRRIGALSAANSVHGRKFAQGGMMSPPGFLINHVAPPAGLAALRGRSQAELYKQQEAERQQRDATTQLLLDNIEAINKRIDTLKVVVIDREITDMQKNTKKVEVKSSW